MGAYDREGDQYPEFSLSLKERFKAVVGSGIPLFTTDADALFDLFLDNLPENAQQHYTCNACRHFVNRYGGLVAISEFGETASTLWDAAAVPEFFQDSVKAMQREVLKAKVTGVFLSEKAVLGTPVTGEWEHMSVTLPGPMVHSSRVKNADQTAADKREDHRILNAALQEYHGTVVDQAVTLLKSEALYRSDKVLGVAEWFKGLRERLDGTKDSKRKANIKWLAVATAPAGFCHIKSSMIGTLLDDLKAGMSIDVVSKRFRDKMDPLQYMRPQSAPTQGNIDQAEKIVEKLGIANSLKRRFAKFEEIPQFLWRPAARAEEARAGGVFGHLIPKGAVEQRDMNLPATTMTWEKFQRTVLPEAEAIEAKVDNPSKCVAMVTAADPEAPNILRWGNTFSWYYRRGGTYSTWNLPGYGFVKVKGVVDSPNHWGDANASRPDYQIFFLLEGSRDVSTSGGGGIFPENLKSELHEVRKTIEAYSNKAVIAGVEESDACGVGYSKDNEWNLTLKVVANNSTRLITIDRWD